jgi:TM2 domain-containing membrane protein YozV
LDCFATNSIPCEKNIHAKISSKMLCCWILGWFGFGSSELILFCFGWHFFSFVYNYVGLGFPLICLCECGLSLQRQMLGKELRGRMIGPMGTNKEKTNYNYRG